jgi:uncharacterized coiled-coil protein SlyX
VTYRYDDDVEYEPEEPPKRRRWSPVIVVVALAITGSASAFLWRAYGNNVPMFPSFGSTPSADAGDKVVVLRDLQAFQQPIVAQTQAATQLLAAQQAEIKRLSDQMTALNAKLDALQHSVASVQPPAAVSVPKPVVPPPVRKKPAAPKPAEASPAGAPPPPPLQLSR